MTTDITELVQRLKVAAKNGCCHTLFPDDCLALVEALENAQHTTTEMENRIRKQNRHVCELFDDNTALRQRISELETNSSIYESAASKHLERAEAAERESDTWRTSFDNERFRADKLKAHIDDIEPIRAAAEKLVRCKGRYHSEQNYRALATLFGVTTPDLPPVDGESRTITIEPFRSFVTDADLAALHRFAECCDDPESGGHDLEKEQVRRLEAIGALQRSGRISYITGFGDFLISITAGIKWEAE